ncbi:11178_t:CDS:2 [Ambispora leptoticha]|uniref:Splicing factor U2AF subunit n=1 Tax=Ambispora leptoticha TaxID=144679 RepID=A0A9N9B3Y5_9GLOM|nr:11178_t:CDS:2 [Ambispora leptoticha]
MQNPGNLDIYWREKNDYIPYDYSQQNVAGTSSSAMGPSSTAEVPYYPENFNNSSSSNQDVAMKDIKIEPSSYFRDRSPDRRHREDESSRRKESERDRGKSREQSRDHRRARDDRDDRDRESRKSRRSRRKSRSLSPRRYSPSARYRSRSRSVTPINKRPRKLNNWDVPPPGYEGMTSEQVKATGHFPLPGQAAVGATIKPPSAPETPLIHIPGMDPNRAALMMGMTHELPPRPKVSQGAAGPVAQTASLARQARRLYVGNIPYGIDERGLSEFFNSTMIQLNITTSPGDPVIAVQINHDKNYAFVEFRAPEEATAAMAFDGITFQGQSLKIRRPKDYQAPPGHDQEPPPIHVPGVVSTNVPDSPHKIFIGGLPTYLNDEQVIELLKSFGELRAFNLVKDSLTGVSKGFAFCEYVDPTVTDLACQGLNNMELGDRKLVVQRASVGSTKNTGVAITSLPPSLLIPANNGEMQPTRILQLLNMVTPEELIDDDEYAGMFFNLFFFYLYISNNKFFLLLLDIFDDVHEECSKYGKIVDMKIPRPTQTGLMAGVGKIFVRYERIEETGVALRALAGRKFAERTVLTSYIDEDRYLADDF